MTVRRHVGTRRPPSADDHSAYADPMNHAVTRLRAAIIVGRKDEPTDGVRDYCEHLAAACENMDAPVFVVPVPWDRKGWFPALWEFWTQLRAARPYWAVLQVTHLAWSKRGFSLGMVLPALVARAAGARVAAVIHDPSGFGGPRWRDRVRTAVQTSGMLALTRICHRLFVTIDPRLLEWTRRAGHKVTLLPVGSNIPARSRGEGNRPGGDGLAIAVFGITEGPKGDEERKTIVEVASQAAQEVGPVTVVAFGRGTAPSCGVWPRRSHVTIEARGIIAPHEASEILERANAMLFIRGGLSSRRGTAVAGIAHGLPVIGFRTGETGWPVTEAGVVLVEPADRKGLAEALVRLWRDPAFAAELQARSRRAHERYFSWSAVANRFLKALEEA